MLDDDDIEELCRGRIIKASFYNSASRNAAGPHYAVILDTDEAVKEHDSYFVAVISHDDEIDAFIVPVPAYTGLNGFIQCSWIEEAHLAGITAIGAKILKPDMENIARTVRAAKAAKAGKKKPKRS